MSVPARNNSMRSLTVTQGTVSPSVGQITLAGALLAADNRVWDTTIGSDATRLNALLKRGHAVVATTQHVRNAREADAAT